MLSGIYQGSDALSSLERWQAAVSQNISNSSVAGYKAVGVGISTAESSKVPDGEDFAAILAKQGTRPEAKICFDQGQIVPSGNPMDCAIDGDGFFQVQGDEGGTIYTRNGQFRLNSENAIVDISGRPVLGTAGTITVNPADGDVRVEEDGQVYQGETRVAKLALVSISDESALRPAGGGYVLDENSDAKAVDLEDARVVQGYYEASNVSPMREMISMITLSRAYEANQRIISNMDSLLGRVTSTFAV
ncbi:MAG: flagellar hook-basal body protein [Opitutales bacterium]|nr:flagellar hook-basal body protein [Opitutales bacterium]